MRDYNQEFNNRVNYIKSKLNEANAKGIIYGNSGGKDCTLVSLLAKAACENVIGVIMPCESKRNYEEDLDDALNAAKAFNIQTIKVDLTSTKAEIINAINETEIVSKEAMSNIAPRLRMTTLYTLAQTKNYLVAGTGNRSEFFMGYFTKWGDGAFDFNPIADLTATEVIEFLKFLDAPNNIISKAPSAGLYEGQTDEKDMGISYKELDDYILNGIASEENKNRLDKIYNATAHKRELASRY